MKKIHSGPNRPTVTGQTNPAELDRHRRAVAKGNTWKTQNRHPDRRSKATHHDVSQPSSARWALTFAVLLAAQHVALASETMNARTKRAMEQRKHPESAASRRSIKVVAPSVRSVPNKATGSTSCPGAVPNTYLSDTISALPTRKKLGIDILRAQGLDPSKKYTFSDLMPGFIAGAEIKGTKPLIDLYMENQITPFPFFFRDNPRVLKNLPDLNEKFEEEFLQYIAETSGLFSHECFQKLSAHGVDELDKADIISVLVKEYTPFSQQFYLPRLSGNRGYILNVHTAQGEKFFAISPKHCDYLVPLSGNDEERLNWVRDNSNLFFEIGTKYSEYIDPHFDKPMHKNTVHDAVIQQNTRLFENCLMSLKKYAFQEKGLETLIHLARGSVVPFYDTARELKEGNYGSAAISAGFDLLDVAGLHDVLKPSALKSIAKALPNKLDDVSTLHKTSKLMPDDLPVARRQPGKLLDQGDTNSSASGTRGAGAAAGREDEIGTLEKLLNADREIQKICRFPNEKCEAVLYPATELLKEAGYQTRIRAMYLWSNANSDVPKNHFVILANKHDVEYVVDMTAGQFSEFDMTKPIIATDDAWKEIYRGSAQRTLIKYKDFKSIAAAKNEFNTIRSVRPDDDLAGTHILAEPSWYAKVVAKKNLGTDGSSHVSSDANVHSLLGKLPVGLGVLRAVKAARSGDPAQGKSLTATAKGTKTVRSNLNP